MMVKKKDDSPSRGGGFIYIASFFNVVDLYKASSHIN